MAWPATGGLFTQPWIGNLQHIALQAFCFGSATPTAPAGAGPDAFKVALYNNTVSATPYSVTLANAVYLVGDWVTGNEVSGTGWAAGGQTLASPSMTESPTGTLMWTCSPVSVSGTTLSGVYGCLIYDSTLATKYGVVGIPFGASYSTTAGTFGITWAAAGIFNIKVV